MSIGKYTSLEEARKQKRLKRFCDEHPSTGDAEKFDRLFADMIAVPEPKSSEEAE